MQNLRNARALNKVKIQIDGINWVLHKYIILRIKCMCLNAFFKTLYEYIN